jgi:hypothetical protein
MIDCSETANYLSEKLRMTKRLKDKGCDIKCSECPLSYTNNGASELISCTTFEMHYPLQAISIVQKWSDEHPQKTYLSELLKYFPKVELNNKGLPKWICPPHLGLNEIEDCGGTDNYCAECWNQPIPIAESEVEE